MQRTVIFPTLIVSPSFTVWVQPATLSLTPPTTVIPAQEDLLVAFAGRQSYALQEARQLIQTWLLLGKLLVAPSMVPGYSHISADSSQAAQQVEGVGQMLASDGV